MCPVSSLLIQRCFSSIEDLTDGSSIPTTFNTQEKSGMRFKDEYQFLSNFAYCRIQIWGRTFTSTEAVYVACKAPPEFREEVRDACATCKTGGEAKRYGRTIPVRSDWDEIKVPVMKAILEMKFSQPYFKKRLLEVTEPIVEENHWHDNFWGDCICDKCKNVVGQNHLGKLLGEIKKELGNEESSR
jgi:ribA/ribD-fused uncharacterized protein